MAACILAAPSRAQATQAAVAISVSPTALSFTSTGITNQYVAANTTLTVTGQITTKSGTGSLQIMSPGDITGSGGGLLKISYFSMTCAGTAQAGASYVAAKTPLVASSSVNCATFASGYDSNAFGGINVTLSLFLDERTLSADTYPASNFTIVATAT